MGGCDGCESVVGVLVVNGWMIVFDNSNPFFLSSLGGNEGKIRTVFVRLT